MTYCKVPVCAGLAYMSSSSRRAEIISQLINETIKNELIGNIFNNKSITSVVFPSKNVKNSLVPDYQM